MVLWLQGLVSVLLLLLLGLVPGLLLLLLGAADGHECIINSQNYWGSWAENLR